MVIDRVIQRYGPGLIVGCLKDADDPVVSKKRLEKAGQNMSSSVLMISQTCFGFYVLKDQFFMPKSLGGSGDYSQVFKNHPYAEHPPYLKEYYLMVSTYHVHSIIHHLMSKRENDFVEMLFHHSITLYLMFGSYMMNVWECGAVISFLHDVPDCFVMTVKVAS